MSNAVIEPRLRASEIPQMVDVDGHIEEQLLRYGQGVTVRPMFQTIPIEDFEWSPDQYVSNLADEYLPQPPWALDNWERELHGLPVSPLCPCGCGMEVPVNRRVLADSPAGVWFVPTVESPAAPTRRELEWATRLDAVPQRIVLGFNSAVQAAFREAAELERVNNQVRAVFNFDATPIQAQINRMQAEVDRLQAARVPLARFVSADANAPTQSARERALELRRNRNTGPDQDQFRHRGQR